MKDNLPVDTSRRELKGCERQVLPSEKSFLDFHKLYGCFCVDAWVQISEGTDRGMHDAGQARDKTVMPRSRSNTN